VRKKRLGGGESFIKLSEKINVSGSVEVDGAIQTFANYLKNLSGLGSETGGQNPLDGNE